MLKSHSLHGTLANFWYHTASLRSVIAVGKLREITPSRVTSCPATCRVEDDSGLKELRKLKPQPFIKGMDLPTFLEKFASWVRVSKIKLENLDEILLAMITDPTTYRKFKSINLTKAEKSNIDLLIEAYNRFLYSETEIAIFEI